MQLVRNDVDNFILKREREMRTTAASTVSEVDNETCFNTDVTADASEPQLCPQIPLGLGPESGIFPHDKDWLTQLEAGGLFKNKKCLSQQTIGIIVPFSGLKKNLLHFLYRLHPFLMKQQSDYQVFVVEYGNKSLPLTRGQLFNAGFVEAQKHRQWQCLVLHEAYLVPLDSRNLYRCNWYPRQLVANIRTSENVTYQSVIGGAIALTPEQYSKVNGFSNRIVGDTADYANFVKRLQWANYTLERNDEMIGKYLTLMEPIPHNERDNTSYPLGVSPLHLIDGLTTISYDLEVIDYQHLYTLVRVNNGEVSENGDNEKLLNVLLSHVLQSTQ